MDEQVPFQNDHDKAPDETESAPSAHVHGYRTSFPSKPTEFLIPEAVFYVGDTLKRTVTPRQYERLTEKPNDIVCADCETPIYFVGNFVKKGRIDVPDHFRTKAGHVHGDSCTYHDRKAMANVEEHEKYDETKPYRIHLNFQDKYIRDSHVRSLEGGRFYTKAKRGKFINELHKDWQPISIKSMDDLLRFIETADPKRLKKSIVILNNRDVLWSEFCLTPRKGQWNKFFHDLSHGEKHLRLFFVQRAHKDGKKMAPLPSDIVRCDEINPKLVSPDERTILNPRLKVSGATIPIIQENLRDGIALLTTPTRLKFLTSANGRARVYECLIDAQIPDFIRGIDYKKLVENAFQRAEASHQSAKAPLGRGFGTLAP